MYLAELNTSMEVVQRNVFTLHEQLMIHDWGLTDNHYVLLANRVKLNSAGTYIYAACVVMLQTCKLLYLQLSSPHS
jgi:carotenoid cleavage dioxygenase-like enzyme